MLAMAFSSIAMSAQAETDPLSGAKQIFETVTSEQLVVTDWDASAITVAVELDVAAVQKQLTSTWISGKKDIHTIFNIGGTWDYESAPGTVGINFNGSIGTKYSTPYGQATAPGSNAQAVALSKPNGLSENLKFTENTPWDTYEKMSLVLTFDGANTVSATWMILDTKGNSTTYYGTNNGIKFTPNYTALTPNGTISNIDTSMVNYAAVFEGAKNQQESSAIAQAVLQRVPEPTTGSLSLLALAGLCARRRKK